MKMGMVMSNGERKRNKKERGGGDMLYELQLGVWLNGDSL